ncbi:MAG: hypothetical protein KGL67_03315 [Patescibacteria group bacterium]|nr:hypothetical protein [Patescibacteria group bacterium]
MKEESPLKRILKTEFKQGLGPNWNGIKQYLNYPKFPSRAKNFKLELADAILNHSISREEFELLTAVDQDTQADVDQFLIEEIWKPLYGDEPISI